MKNASLPRVVSLEGISKQLESFKIESNARVNENEESQRKQQQSNNKQNEHIGNAWRLPSLYDWSQGEIMNLKLSDSVIGDQSPKSILESAHTTNKKMVYIPKIIDEGFMLSEDTVYHHRHQVEALEERVVLDLGGSPVSALKFSPMCSQLVVGTRNGEWSEWNPEDGTKLLCGSCGNREISSLQVIGEAGGRITAYTRYVLLTACTDSTVMLWRVDRYGRDIRMVFSCRCWSQFDDMVENMDYSRSSKKFAMAWEPNTAKIATNRRNPGVVRFWDLPQEMCFARCRVPLDSCIDSLTWTGSIAHMGPQCLFGGTDNGSLFLIDMRTKNAIETTPLEHSTHNDAIVRVICQASNTGGHLLSASRDGVVCVWDPRKLSGKDGLEPITILQLGQVEFLSAHTYLPIFACKTMESSVDIFNVQGDLLKSLEIPECIEEQNRVNWLSFDIQRPYFGVGQENSTVRIYSASHFSG